MNILERVAYRWRQAASLRLGPAQPEQRATEALSRMKLVSKNRGDRTSATISAGYHAKKQKDTMYIYEGNSFMHQVWRVSNKPGEYLNAVNNTGPYVYSVTPDLIVSRHDVLR